MKKIWVIVCCALFATFSARIVAQRNFDDIEIRTTSLTGPIHVIEGSGGNIGVSAGEDGILIVDDQFAPLAPRIESALSDISEGNLRFVVNTHFHGDHTGGNEFFGSLAPIIAHSNVRRRLLDQPQGAWPTITIDDDVSLHLNGEEIRLVHYPTGHTDGDVIVFFTGSNVVHMGDHFWVETFPFIDIDGGGNAIGYTDNIGDVLSQVAPDARIIPGHGPARADVDDLRRFHRMLEESIEMVREKHSAGRSSEQIQEEGVLAAYASWSGNGERFLDSIYRSLE